MANGDLDALSGGSEGAGAGAIDASAAPNLQAPAGFWEKLGQDWGRSQANGGGFPGLCSAVNPKFSQGYQAQFQPKQSGAAAPPWTVPPGGAGVSDNTAAASGFQGMGRLSSLWSGSGGGPSS